MSAGAAEQSPITLRAFRDEDTARFQKWLAAAHVARWYEHPADWLDEIARRHGAFSWLRHFIVLCGGVRIGFCQYYDYRRGGETWHGDADTSGAYSIDYLIGEPEYLGRGLGRALIAALADEIRREPDARRILVQPDPANKASCAALRSAGFAFDAANEVYVLEV